jgi:hypothetical protein
VIVDGAFGGQGCHYVDEPASANWAMVITNGSWLPG